MRGEFRTSSVVLPESVIWLVLVTVVVAPVLPRVQWPEPKLVAPASMTSVPEMLPVMISGEIEPVSVIVVMTLPLAVSSRVVEPLVTSVALEVPVKPLTMIVSVGPKLFTVPANAVPAVICRVFAVASVKVTSSFAATVPPRMTSPASPISI